MGLRGLTFKRVRLGLSLMVQGSPLSLDVLVSPLPILSSSDAWE